MGRAAPEQDVAALGLATDTEHAKVATTDVIVTPDDDMHTVSVGWRELGLGAAALMTWFSLFAGGILVNTEPARTALTAASTFAERVSQLPIILCCWTVTNVGCLACLAAVLGAVGRRTHFTSGNTINHFDQSTTLRLRVAAIYYASAIMRGFGVYALVLGGLLVLATDTLVTPTQEEYLRLASTTSVISFYAGYDPEMFAGILERAQGFFRKHK